MNTVQQKYRQAPVAELTPHPRNPRQGDVGAIHQSIDANGFYGAIVVQKATGYVLAGNHRLLAAKAAGAAKVPVIEIDCDDETATRILLADNRTNDLASYDDSVLANLLTELAAGPGLDGTGYDGDDLDALLESLAYGEPEEQDRLPDALPNPRELPIDVVFTHTYTSSCCVAVAAGLRYGLQSGKEPCRYHESRTGRHRVVFLDNDWKDYDHETHMRWVEQLKPKYATTRDLVTRKQAGQFGVDYYSIEQVLEMADEVTQHAEYAIVIPKYDCLDKIPEHHVLGYSVPTSHGGTPLPPEAFKGRKVHLLGGSWKEQLKYLTVLGDDVVSLDNNYISRISEFGSYTMPDGSTGTLSSNLNITQVTNPAHIALAISLGSIAYATKTILGQRVTADESVTLKEEP